MKGLQRQALKRIGKNWSKASLTRAKLLSNVAEFAGYVADVFGLEKIENFKARTYPVICREPA